MKRKFLVFFLLGIVMHKFVSAQGEIQRMKKVTKILQEVNITLVFVSLAITVATLVSMMYQVTLHG